MKKLFFGTAAAAFVAGASLLSPTAAYAAPEIPCETAKLIVPWKAGGGTHILFSIFEKTIQEMGLKPKLKVVTVPGQGGNKGAKEAAKAKKAAIKKSARKIRRKADPAAARRRRARRHLVRPSAKLGGKIRTKKSPPKKTPPKKTPPKTPRKRR